MTRDKQTGELVAVTFSDEWQEAQLFELRKINGSLLVLRLLLFGRVDEARRLADEEAKTRKP
jgi:hypothetical protein